jgi:hypothetical protein
LEEANNKALATLEEILEDKIDAIMQKHQQRYKHRETLKVSTGGCLAESTSSEPAFRERGRSRESFQKSQDRLLIRARSISTERELQLVISDARSLAATERS